jgi:protoporphyrinogen oxidase
LKQEHWAIVGGLAGAWRLGSLTWNRHYHVTLLSDSALRDLLTELDLERDMCWRKTRTGFYCNGRLYAFSSAMDFATFPLLNPGEKVRFGLGILRASRLRSPETIGSLTVQEWLTRISGKSVFDKISRPVLRAKLGDDYPTTSATFVWARYSAFMRPPVRASRRRPVRRPLGYCAEEQ